MTRCIGIVGLAAALLAACGGSNAPPQAATTSSSSSDTMSSGSMSSAMSANTSCAPSGTTIKLVAKDTMFDASCLAAPAGQAITVTFDNEDSGIIHNLAIYSADPMEDKNAKTLFKGDLVTGVKTVTYNIPSLSAGTYHFHCDVHPTQMYGTFVVK
jgi:plastocyanin